MTTIAVNSAATLKQAMLDAVGGDIIELASTSTDSGGKYASVIHSANSSALTKSSPVIIRPANRSTPPVFGAVGIRFDVKGQFFTIDGVNFIGTAVEYNEGGVQYPGGDDIVKYVAGCEDMKVLNCIFKFHRKQLRLNTNCNRFEIGHNDFLQVGIDSIMSYGACDDLNIHHNNFTDPRIYLPLDGQADRHPDIIQLRTNTEQVNVRPYLRLKINDNRFIYTSETGKAVFHNNEVSGASGSGGGGGTEAQGIGIDGFECMRNDMALGRWCAISWCSGLNVDVYGNRIRSLTTVTSERPRIAPEQVNSGRLANNVMHMAVYYSEGSSAGQFTQTPANVVSTTANPSGWKDLVPGLATPTATQVGVGPYTGGIAPPPPLPAQPVNEWQNPPTNTVPGDGRFATYAEVLPALVPPRYTGVLIIPSDAAAFAAASVGSTVTGGPAVNVRWDGHTATSPKPFKFANPAFNSAGSVRLEMTHGGGGNLDIYSVEASGVLSNLTWEWKQDGGSTWSGLSTYTGSVTAPGTPPVATLPALTSVQWEFTGSMYDAGLPGRYVKDLRIIPGTGVAAFTSVQWTPAGGDGQWRNCQNVGLDGDSAILWQPQPLVAGGVEHTVQYEETLTVSLRYGDGTDFSDPSVTTKSFTGPALPPPVYGNPGAALAYGGNQLAIGGVPVTLPNANAPPAIGAETIGVDRVDDTVTVTLPSSLPPGAVGQMVVYGGQYFPAADGIATFTAIAGQTFCLAMAFDDQTPPRVGPALYAFVPDTAPAPIAVGTLSDWVLDAGVEGTYDASLGFGGGKVTTYSLTSEVGGGVFDAGVFVVGVFGGGSMPSWLTIDPETGLITIADTSVVSPLVTYTVVAVNSSGMAVQTLDITVLAVAGSLTFIGGASINLIDGASLDLIGG